MVSLTKGGNAPLGATTLQVSVVWQDRDPNAEELDVSCFLLTDAKKIRTDDDMIFYGQRQSKDGAVQIRDLAVTDTSGRKTIFTVDLSKLSADVTSVAIVGTTGATQDVRPVSTLQTLSITATPATGDPITFDITRVTR